MLLMRAHFYSAFLVLAITWFGLLLPSTRASAADYPAHWAQENTQLLQKYYAGPITKTVQGYLERTAPDRLQSTMAILERYLRGHAEVAQVISKAPSSWIVFASRDPNRINSWIAILKEYGMADEDIRTRMLSDLQGFAHGNPPRIRDGLRLVEKYLSRDEVLQRMKGDLLSFSLLEASEAQEVILILNDFLTHHEIRFLLKKNLLEFARAIPGRLRGTIAILKGYQVGPTEIRNLLHTDFRSMVFSEPYRLTEVLNVLAAYGLSNSELRQLLINYMKFLSASDSTNVSSVLKILEEQGLTRQDICSRIQTSPLGILGLKPKKIQNGLSSLTSQGLSSSEISERLISNPSGIARTNPQNFEKNVAVLLEIGLNQDQISALLARSSLALTTSSDRLKNLFQIFEKYLGRELLIIRIVGGKSEWKQIRGSLAAITQTPSDTLSALLERYSQTVSNAVIRAQLMGSPQRHFRRISLEEWNSALHAFALRYPQPGVRDTVALEWGPQGILKWYRLENRGKNSPAVAECPEALMNLAKRE